MENIKKIISIESLRSKYPGLVPYIRGSVDDKYILGPMGNWDQYPYDIDINLCGEFSVLREKFGCTEDNGRVSFCQIVSKWRDFNRVFKTVKYHKKIRKRDGYKWVDYEPTLKEKIETPIIKYTTFRNPNWEGNGPNINIRYIGVYENDFFNDNGGGLMLKFLMKAIGLFTVDSTFIRKDNNIPSVMYYCEIETYINRMKMLKTDDKCCLIDEYTEYGGDNFIFYLRQKINERQQIFQYWCERLYMDNKENKPTANMYLPVSLNCKYNNIGLYSDIIVDEENNSVLESNINDESCLRFFSVSRLHELKRTKKTFFEIKEEDDNGNEVIKQILMPVILDEVGINEFVLTPKYVVGVAKNISIGEDGNIYGDVIYDIQVNDTFEWKYDIYYVLGGRLILYTEEEKNNNEFGFLQNYKYDISSNTGVRYKERVSYEYKNYFTEENLECRQLLFNQETNILKCGVIRNVKNVKIIYDVIDTDSQIVEGEYYPSHENRSNTISIMFDYDFNKTERLNKNIDDVVIDRGYVSAFELHYKIGEINTFKDLENYQNNIFGI